MVSAVLDSPGDNVAPTAAAASASRSAARTVAAAAASQVQPRPHRAGFDGRGLGLKVLSPLIGLALLVGLWALATQKGGSFPKPAATWDAAVQLLADPFSRSGPNDQGIGWHLLLSLQRVAQGCGLAALVGIPLGFLIGRFEIARRIASPLISLLQRVSPLAWLPIGLLAFKSAHPAAVWTLLLCALWPMVAHTAIGVQRVPQAYLNVARVLRLSEWQTITRILLPAVLPHVLTGVRRSVGVAWLVVVAAEMLTGGVGIGAWVWAAWGHLHVAHVLVGMVVIGIVGLLLDGALRAAARPFSFEG